MKKSQSLEFELQGHDYIELNSLLKIMGWVDSGGEANNVISNGEVTVNGAVETRKRNKLQAGAKVIFKGKKVVIVAQDNEVA